MLFLHFTGHYTKNPLTHQFNSIIFEQNSSTITEASSVGTNMTRRDNNHTKLGPGATHADIVQLNRALNNQPL